MPVKTRSAKCTSRPRLPHDIQLCILESMIALGKADTRVRVSPCAAVCKTWQTIIEREVFRHLTLSLKDMKSFAKYCDSRKHHVKHILLELFLCPTTPRTRMNEICFTKATKALFQVLSTWDVHGVTLELGVIRCRGFELTGCPESFHIHSNPVPPRKRPLHLEALQDVAELDQEDMSDPSLTDQEFVRELLDHFGYKPLALDMGSPNDAPLLDEVACVSKLLIRRQYMPNISPRSLSTIMRSLPSLESLQIERWWYGYGEFDYDDVWDAEMDKMVLALPKSLKMFSFYEETGTNFLARPGGTITRCIPEFLETFINAADRIEHIAITYLAGNLFTSQAEFKALRTIALYSAGLLSPMERLEYHPLTVAAVAAKRMPQLETLEVWGYTPEKVAIFTYEKLGQYRGCITWKENGTVRTMTDDAQAAWKELADEQNGTLEVKHEQLSWNKGDGLGALYPHLALRDRILHDITWTQVSIHPIEFGEMPGLLGSLSSGSSADEDSDEDSDKDLF